MMENVLNTLTLLFWGYLESCNSNLGSKRKYVLSLNGANVSQYVKFYKQGVSEKLK